MENILEIRGLTKTYPGVVALNNLSLSVRRGECHAIVGENGAGKSTLIKSVAGAITPDSGTITFEGTEYTSLDPTLSKKIGIGVIYQEFVLCPALTIAENIFLGERLTSGVFQNEALMNQKAQEILDRFKVEGLKATALVRDLSTAYQQLVEIAKAIAKKSKLIIMDEPTAPLTEREVSVLFRIIQELKASGITIIYISHRLDELYEVSDRVTVMRDGCYITTTDTADVTKDQLIAYMVGRELKKDFAERNSRTEEVLLETKNLGGNGVEPFSIKLHKGEVLGFGGLVGAGRTEYAQLIFGAAPKECGSIYLNGQKIEINSPEDAVKYGIGMVPEDRKQCGALLRMSIRENIVVSILKRISNRFSFVDRSQEKKIADEQMNALRIKAPSADVLVNNLSGGNQQKVVLAKWLANNSQVLILDEPTRGIDVGAKQEIYKLIDELAAQGKGIIVISSDMEEIMGITDRMLILYEGTLKGELQRAEYQQERILKHTSGEN